MKNKWLLLLCLAIMAVFAACGRTDAPPPESPSGDMPAAVPGRTAPPGDIPDAEPSRIAVPAPEGPFIFYNDALGWQNYLYGIISDTGEIILPVEYLLVLPVYRVEQGYRDLPPPSERYYVAAIAGGPVQAESHGDMYERLDHLDALVSPTGEVLTEHIYDEIFSVNGRIVGYLAEGRQPVVIDPLTGTHRALEAADSEWMTDAPGYFNNTILTEVDPTLQKTGPDVPKSGFDYVIENPDGTYYGCYDNGYSYGYRLFAADGTHLNDKVYEYLNKIDEGFYSYHITRPNNYYTWSEGLIRDGKEITEQIYSRIYAQGDYILLIDDFNLTVTDKSLNTLYTYENPSNSSDRSDAYLAEQQGVHYLCYSSDVSPSFVVNLDTGARTDFSGFEGGRISSVLAGGDRFILYRVDYIGDYAWTTHYLVNDKGELLLAAPGIMEVNDYLVVYHFIYPGRDLYNRYLYGLYDRDGHVLLPQEYHTFELLGGNAALVVRGDWAGIIDLEGNWIYKESVYQYLD